MEKQTLQQRLDDGGVLCAEGFLFEVERRGYMASGAFVPEVALENPDALMRVAKTHFGIAIFKCRQLPCCRKRLLITPSRKNARLGMNGKEHLLQPRNRAALQLAGQVAKSPRMARLSMQYRQYVCNAPNRARCLTNDRQKCRYYCRETFYYAGENARWKRFQLAGLPAQLSP